MMSRRRKLWKSMPLVRAIVVLSAVGITTTLVTFSAIQSTGNALTGNTIQTATAALKISTQGQPGTYSDSVPGFTFSGIVPGGAAQPTANGGYAVYLDNVGSANLSLNVTVPAQPTMSGTADLTKVWLYATPYTSTGAATTQKITLADLLAGKVSLNVPALAPASVQMFRLQVAMDADAVSASGLTISNLDLAFGGTLAP